MISRLLVLSVLLVIDVSGLNAQVVRSFGIKAGLTASNIRSPDFKNEGLSFSFDEDRRRGLLIMAFVEWIESGTLSIITEAGYIPRGNENAQLKKGDCGRPILLGWLGTIAIPS